MSYPLNSGRALADLPGILKFSENFEGSGYRALKTKPLIHMREVAAGAEDIIDQTYLRRASYVGGNGGSPLNGGVGWTNVLMRKVIEVGEHARANEWASLNIMHNLAPGFGPGAIAENCASYNQAEKGVRADGQAVAPTIVAVDELVDNEANPAWASGVQELNITLNGNDNTDDNHNRFFQHLFARANGGATGGVVHRAVLVEAGPGVHIDNIWEVRDGGGTYGKYFNFPGFMVDSKGVVTVGKGSATSIGPKGFGFTPGTRTDVGFDTSNSYMLQAAFKMAEGQSVAFDQDAVRQMRSVGGELIYSVFGVPAVRLWDQGIRVGDTGTGTPGFGGLVNIAAQNADNAIVGTNVNNLPADTAAFATAVTGYSRLYSAGGQGFAGFFRADLYASRGVSTTEFNSFNFSGPPSDALPPNRAFGTPERLPIAQTVAPGGDYDSSIGTHYVREGENPRSFLTGIYMSPGAIKNWAIYLDALESDTHVPIIAKHSTARQAIAIRGVGAVRPNDAFLTYTGGDGATKIAIKQSGKLLFQSGLVQSSVGAAGGAAPMVTPAGYLQVETTAGNYLIPIMNAA